MSPSSAVGFSEHFRDIEVRFLTAPNGQPVVVAADAVEALKGNRTNTSAIVKKYVREKWVIDMPNPNGGKDLKCLFEPGLYQLAVNPMFQTEFALTFQDWVFEEILPKLRAEGGYIMPNATQQQLEALNKQLEQRLAIAEKKADLYVNLSGITMKDFYSKLKLALGSKFKAKLDHFCSATVDYIFDLDVEPWREDLGGNKLSDYYYPLDKMILASRQYLMTFERKAVQAFDEHFEEALDLAA